MPISNEEREINPADAILSADISVDYPQRKGVLQGARLDVFRGEILGLVGQSGSGKSTFALAVLKLLDHTRACVSGRIELLGADLTSYNERQLRSIRGRLINLIPQSPLTALNPALRIGTQLREAWRAHSSERWSAQEGRITRLFTTVNLFPAEAFLKRFPRELSIGQAQRVLIIMALLHSPKILIADEPTSALDTITQREILDLLVRVGKQQKMGILFISHDLPAIAAVCDRLAILHEGKIVECGHVKKILTAPQHPYTKDLIAAVPKWAPANNQSLTKQTGFD